MANLDALDVHNIKKETVLPVAVNYILAQVIPN
jgi:hypothetical protein